ncbi:MAG TPA: AAA family ATPase [Candidatus Limnocylindrales bacterium]|nr:AAA family ATPase [Candidatus Limnocylindrales bacterium]
MRLERVLVEGFGPLAGFEAVLEPRRLNLIIGPNESGKSSFAAAISATLFGFASHEEEQRSKPWNGAPHRATLVLDAAGLRHRIRRDFETHEVRVDRLAPKGDEVEAALFQGTANPRGRGPELEQYETLLRTWFGFADARLFRESCFVHENALATKISPELRHLISGAVEADYQEIQNALMGRLDALTREHPDPRKQKRADRSIEKRLANLELLRGRLARSEYVLRELKSNVAERTSAEARVSDLKADMTAKEQLIANLETLVRLREEQRKNLKRGMAIGEELTRARRARGRLQEIDRRVADNLAYLANAPEEVESDLLRLEILRNQRSRHQKTNESERKRLEESNPPSMVLVIVVGLVIGAALGFLGYAAFKSAVAAGVGGVLGAAAGMLAMRLFGRNAERGRALSEAKVRVTEENTRNLKQEIEGIEIRVNPYLKGRPVETVTVDLKQLRELENERREHAAVVHSLPMPERLEAESHEIDDTVNGLRAKEKFLVGQTPFLAPFKDDPMGAAEASDRLRREVNGAKTKIEAEQESLDRLMRRVGGANTDAENIEGLEESIAAEEEGLRLEERQRDALLLAIETLNESVLDYQKEHVARLARTSGRTLSLLTRGRYSGVALDADLNPTVRMDGQRDLPVEALSHGTRDAFYFCLRAALAQELAAREPLPLVLDDPTAHFDEERRGALLECLENLAGELQIIFLTHDRRVLNQIREAHVLKIGTDASASDSDRKIQVRR